MRNVLTLLMMMTTTDSIHCMLMIRINNITLEPPMIADFRYPSPTTLQAPLQTKV